MYGRPHHLEVSVNGHPLGKRGSKAVSLAGNISWGVSGETNGTTVFNLFQYAIWRRDCNGAARSDVLPTATQVLSVMQEPEICDSIEVTIVNTSDGSPAAERLSLFTDELSGTTTNGLTIRGYNIIDEASAARVVFVCTSTSTPSFDVFILQSGPRSLNPYNVTFQGNVTLGNAATDTLATTAAATGTVATNAVTASGTTGKIIIQPGTLAADTTL